MRRSPLNSSLGWWWMCEEGRSAVEKSMVGRPFFCEHLYILSDSNRGMMIPELRLSSDRAFELCASIMISQIAIPITAPIRMP